MKRIFFVSNLEGLYSVCYKVPCYLRPGYFPEFYRPHFTDLIPVEQILKNFRSCFKVLEYGIHYQTTSKMPRLLVYSSV